MGDGNCLSDHLKAFHPKMPGHRGFDWREGWPWIAFGGGHGLPSPAEQFKKMGRNGVFFFCQDVYSGSLTGVFLEVILPEVFFL